MPLVYLAIAFLTGVFVASSWQSPAIAALPGLFVSLAALIASCWHPGLRMPALCGLAILAGMWRYDAAAQANRDSPELAAVAGKGPLAVRGVVEAPPEMREMRQNLRLNVRELQNDGRWQKAQGNLLVYAGLAPAFEYGDSLELFGQVEDPPELDGFDYRQYLSRQGIHHVMSRPSIRLIQREQGLVPLVWTNSLRTRLSDALGLTLPEPEASVAQGILLGTRSAMPNDLLSAFATTGTTHILAISGYNISLIAAAFMALATRVMGKNRAVYVAVLGISSYSVLAGASPSIMRATVMGIMVIAAYRVGRRSHVINALAVSAAALVAARPDWLWDAGFQLSFLATIGLIFVARPLSTLVTQAAGRVAVLANPALKGTSSFLIDGTSISAAATIYTLPLIAFDFHTVSLISPLANVVAVPALPPIMVGAAVVAFLGLFSLPVAQLAALAAWPFVAYLVGVVDLLAGFPNASLPTPPLDPAFVWAYYAVLTAFTAALHIGRDSLANTWLRMRTVLGVLAHAAGQILTLLPAKWTIPATLLISVVAWAAVFSLPDDKLHVTFLDVGQGDAILIRTPDNQKLLVDGGPSPQRLLNQLGRSVPFWDRRIDMVVLTHPDEDHLTGLLGVVERYKVGMVLEGPDERPTPIFQSWHDTIAQKSIRRQVVRSGQRFRVGQVEMAVVFAPEASSGDQTKRSNASLVLRLQMGDISFLLPGDTPAESQFRLLDLDVRSTVLKIPHHGAGDALDERFLAAANPKLAVISVGADNSFGHPAPETLAMLSGIRTMRTDEKGTIEAITDGRKLWVRVER